LFLHARCYAALKESGNPLSRVIFPCLRGGWKNPQPGLRMRGKAFCIRREFIPVNRLLSRRSRPRKASPLVKRAFLFIDISHRK
jgi:hypothetical protein